VSDASSPPERRAAGAVGGEHTRSTEGHDAIEIAVEVNGEVVTLAVDPGERLLDTLRYRLGLTGTKEGCAEGECGACTVWLDGIPVNSCLVPTFQIRGRSVVTVESSAERELEPLLRSGATQCGACTPGVVMTARWVASRSELLDTYTVRELMAGNLCRCTGYDGIVDGVEAMVAASDAAASGASDADTEAAAPSGAGGTDRERESEEAGRRSGEARRRSGERERP
jgi:carbon-monoxide dehydrogenase small subunit